MAVFTPTLRQAIEYAGGRTKFDETCLREYPIFDESYRQHLNDAIVQHYMFREIGLETVEMFMWSIRNELREQADVFNPMFKTVKNQYDPLNFLDYSTVFASANESSQHSESNNSGNTTQKSESDGTTTNYDMPNVAMTPRGNYATSGARTESGSSGDSSSRQSGTDTSTGAGKSSATTKVTGRNIDPAQAIAAYRQNLLSGDRFVIDILANCFIGLWHNGDGYGPTPWPAPLPGFMGGAFYGLY